MNTADHLDSGHCPVCNSRSGQLRHRVSDYEYLTCDDCSATRINPFPTKEFLRSWYLSDDYFHSSDHDIGYKNYAEQKTGLQRTFKARNKLLGDKIYWRDKRLLEIGCGLGYYPEILQDLTNVTYLGVDLNPSAVAKVRGKGFNVIEGEISSLPEKKPFDIIIFFDLLEHIPDPHLFFDCLKRRLSQRGKILFSTPSTDSIVSRISGARWVSYITPQHVLLYNKKSIRFLLEQNGFEIITMKYDIQWVTTDFLFDRLGDLFSPLKKAASLFRYSNRPFPILIPVPNGNMIVTARLIGE